MQLMSNVPQSFVPGLQRPPQNRIPARQLTQGLKTRCEAQKNRDAQVQERFELGTQAVERRGLLSGALFVSLCATVGSSAQAAPLTAGANIFGAEKRKRTEFIVYKGDSFALRLPSKWNPATSTGAYPGIVLRYEDNGDQANNLEVVKMATGKKSIKEYGDPAKFLQEVKFLFGENVWQGSTISEGGFKKDQVYSTSILEMRDDTDKSGKEYYRFELLNRTADGAAGGNYILLSAAVNSGQLHLCKVQIPFKRWVRGADRDGKGAVESFTVV